jgi:two-component system, OmpR family, osmolarity sensor histidine kinase EnvZ
VLLAGISHDLRTPLTRLRLEIEINDLPPAARDAMAGDIDQMDAIVAQFLDYARSGSRQAAELLNLAELAHEALARNRMDSEHQVTLHVDLQAVPPIAGRRVELSRALDNLLTNASRYGRDAEGALTLHVSLRAVAQNAVLEIADSGAGVPAEQFDRLLRPFERGDTARGEARGAGLGLAIVERVARQHGGSVQLEAHEPSGLLVRISLPMPS